jgi:hypothetical protein
MREREGLVSRIRQIRRTAAARTSPPPEVRSGADVDRFGALATRVDHLEQLLQALQDSVHRDSERYGKRITELEAQIQPAALGAALSKDARERGL